MSTPHSTDPRVEPAALSDEQLLAAHEQATPKPGETGGRFPLPPLNLLAVLAGLIVCSVFFLSRYAGDFHPQVYDERGKAPAPGAAAAAPVDPLVLGKNIYAQVCVTCHQPTGLGLPPAFPPLVGSEWLAGSEERVIRILLHGLQGPIKVKGTEFNGAMPAVGPGSGYNLNPQKIAAVLTYVRKEWAGINVPISPAKVSEIRAKDGARAAMTAPELEKIP